MGGAELSLLKALQNVEDEYDHIYILSCANYKGHELFSKYERIKVPFKLKWLKRMPYVEYFFVKRYMSRRIVSCVQTNDISEIWCQNVWAPMVANAGCSVRIFLRDEAGLGVRPIYFTGLQKVFSIIHRVIDFPFWWVYRRDLRHLYSNCSEVIANSNWMKEQFHSLFGKVAVTSYPDININELRRLYNAGPIKPSSVVMIGSEYVKGFETFIRLAIKFPDTKFVVFSKQTINKKLPDNLGVKGWSADRSEPYRCAKVVLVPSVWNEAYGRVAAEARALNIPVIVSHKGGLPEAVNHDTRCIARSFYEFELKLRALIP